MDNYLGFRWPGEVIPAESEPSKGRGRRIWRIILTVILVLAVIGGLIAGGFFGAQYLAGRWLAGLPDVPAVTDPIGPTHGLGDAGSWTAEMLPWGEPDPGVQLDLRSNRGAEELTAGEIYKKLLPSIVCVESGGRQGYSIGSGIVISQSGYIITNYHIIEGGESLGVMRLSDREVFDAVVIGFDEELDLAVIKAEGGAFLPAVLGDSDELAVGDAVYAIGNPLGYLYGTFTDGIVSALGERIGRLKYPGRLIQTTAALNSGNSGGALVDIYGRVVGITTAKITGVQDDVVIEGLGLAIPLGDAQAYLNRILRTGKSARPAIGVLCENVKGGVLVQKVEEGTPAEGCILPGDIISGANGIDAATVDDLLRIFSRLEPGDRVLLKVNRDREELLVTVELYDYLSKTT